MMEVEASVPVLYGGAANGDELRLGKSSWDSAEKSLKYAWPDKKGRASRGGELPVASIPQAVMFAATSGALTRNQMRKIGKGLIDVLARPSSP